MLPESPKQDLREMTDLIKESNETRSPFFTTFLFHRVTIADLWKGTDGRTA